MINLLVTLVIIGVVLYLINTVVPMPNWVKKVINCVAGVFVLLLVLKAFGIYTVPLRLN